MKIKKFRRNFFIRITGEDRDNIGGRFLTIIFVMLIFILPFGSASVEITSQLKDEYNLGDNIQVSLKIIPTISVDALIRLTLKCSNKEILYYTAPIALEKDKEVIIEAPAIKAFSEGLCSILANVELLEGENLEGITSKDFIISNRLELSFTLDKTTLLPGDIIKIEGTAKKKEGIVEDGSIVVTLDNKKAQISLDGDEFSYDLKLDDNIKSGEHIIRVKANDSYGNFEEESRTINVEAVPTKLEFELYKKEFKPKETLKLKVDLLDQANDSIEGNTRVRLFKEKTLFKDEIIIFDKEIEANKEFDFTFEHNTTPNDYILKAVFNDLEKEEVIKVLPHQEIEMRLEADIIFIENIGNVKYNNKTTIILEKENRTYIINKRIKLDVGEETAIDLSKEVPSGNYTVSLPSEAVVEEKVVEKIVEKVVEKEVPVYIEKEEVEEGIKTKEAVNIIENVEIEDNRAFYKKGLSFITGGIVAGAGLLLKRPKMASFIMVVFILSIICYFNRKGIGRIIEKIRERRNEKM